MISPSLSLLSRFYFYDYSLSVLVVREITKQTKQRERERIIRSSAQFCSLSPSSNQKCSRSGARAGMSERAPTADRQFSRW